ncbi:MAG: hypothetical protein ACKVJN_11820, partial [Woeseiales bacterium]
VDPELLLSARSGEGEATELIRSAFCATESEWLADCATLTEKNAKDDESVAYTGFVVLCPTEADDPEINRS